MFAFSCTTVLLAALFLAALAGCAACLLPLELKLLTVF